MSPGYLQTDQETDRDRLATLTAALRRSQSTGDLDDHDLGDLGDLDPGVDPGLDLRQSSTEVTSLVTARDVYLFTQFQSPDGQDNPRAIDRGSTVTAGPGLAQSAGNVSGIKLMSPRGKSLHPGSILGGVRRNRPKMVRQNHIDIDSDSSESKSHLLPWNTNTLPLPSKKHKERLARDVSLTSRTHPHQWTSFKRLNLMF